MNILITIADLGLGGAQQVVINLANELVRLGHQVILFDVYPELRKEGMVKKIENRVTLISRRFKEQPLDLIERLVNSFFFRTGINKEYIRSKRKKQHRIALFKLINNQQIDAVNSHVYWADEFVLEYLPNLHHNWWITLHGSYSGFIKSSKYLHQKKQITRFFNHCKGYIYLANTELEILKQLPGWNTPCHKKVYNGIPLLPIPIHSEPTANWNEMRPLKALIASRAIREKGWEEAIIAITELRQKGLFIELQLIGDGPILIDIKRKYEHLKFVKFHGYHSEIEKKINQIDLLLLPSYYEALPTILIEGISLGKPAIATNVGEIHAILTGEYECGILINGNPKTLVSSIKSALKAYYYDLALYKNHSKNCLLNVKKFKIETMANEYLDLFKSEKFRDVSF